MFCADFKALVSQHLSTCGECRESLTGALKYVSDAPIFKMLLNRAGMDVREIQTIISGKGKTDGNSA